MQNFLNLTFIFLGLTFLGIFGWVGLSTAEEAYIYFFLTIIQFYWASVLTIFGESV